MTSSGRLPLSWSSSSENDGGGTGTSSCSGSATSACHSASLSNRPGYFSNISANIGVSSAIMASSSSKAGRPPVDARP